MSKEKSPFEGKKMSIIKLGEVMEYLIKYDRAIWLKMCKGSKVILKEGNVVMGPFPNWKAYRMLCQILAFEQEKAQIRTDAAVLAHQLGAKLFITAY